MPKAGEFLKKEMEGISQQTLSPRDFLNKQYILRYEDVVETLNLGGHFRRDDFVDALHKLYYSFIVPRKSILEGSETKILEYVDCFKNQDSDRGLIMLELIAKLLFEKGFVRTEKASLPVGHEWMEDLEVV